MNDGNPNSLKDISKITKWLKIFSYLSIIGSLISISTHLKEWQHLKNVQQELDVFVETADNATSYLLDSIEFTGDVLNLTSIVIFVLFMVFIYRVNFNTHIISNKNLKFSPKWAVGWFFVPIANFWKFYQVLKEIWQESCHLNNTDQKNIKYDHLKWFWGVWIHSFYLANKSVIKSWKAVETSELISSAKMSIVSDFYDIISITLLIILIKRIYRLQVSSYKVRGQLIEA